MPSEILKGLLHTLVMSMLTSSTLSAYVQRPNSSIASSQPAFIVAAAPSQRLITLPTESTTMLRTASLHMTLMSIATQQRVRTRVLCMVGACVCAFALVCAPAFAQTQTTRATALSAAPTAQRTVLVMGDSLSAAYGLSASQGWVALTAQKIAKEKPGWRVVNASISGETTAGGAARIAAELKRHKPAVVVIELGGNDGLRGLPLKQTRDNLTKMIVAAQGAKAKVLLIGMRLPPNYGPDYTRGFENAFRELAAQHKTALLPFLLQPIMTDRNAFQGDQIHPTAAAQPKLRDHVWPTLSPLLRSPAK
jgi:acyl-CoA thioesterase I